MFVVFFKPYYLTRDVDGNECYSLIYPTLNKLHYFHYDDDNQIVVHFKGHQFVLSDWSLRTGTYSIFDDKEDFKNYEFEKLLDITELINDSSLIVFFLQENRILEYSFYRNTNHKAFESFSGKLYSHSSAFKPSTIYKYAKSIRKPMIIVNNSIQMHFVQRTANMHYSFSSPLLNDDEIYKALHSIET